MKPESFLHLTCERVCFHWQYSQTTHGEDFDLTGAYRDAVSMPAAVGAALCRQAREAWPEGARFLLQYRI